MGSGRGYELTFAFKQGQIFPMSKFPFIFQSKSESESSFCECDLSQSFSNSNTKTKIEIKQSDNVEDNK